MAIFKYMGVETFYPTTWKFPTFGANTCFNLMGRNIEDSSFTLHDRLAFSEHNMGVCDNANILAKSLRAAMLAATLRLIFGLYLDSMMKLCLHLE